MKPRFFDLPFWKNPQTYIPLLASVSYAILTGVLLRRHHLTGWDVQCGFFCTGLTMLPIVVVLQYWFYMHFKRKETGPSESVRAVGDWSSRILVIGSTFLWIGFLYSSGMWHHVL
jgi:hypothetical protein